LEKAGAPFEMQPKKFKKEEEPNWINSGKILQKIT